MPRALLVVLMCSVLTAGCRTQRGAGTVTLVGVGAMVGGGVMMKADGAGGGGSSCACIDTGGAVGTTGFALVMTGSVVALGAFINLVVVAAAGGR